jgi:hypothetical protein
MSRQRVFVVGLLGVLAALGSGCWSNDPCCSSANNSVRSSPSAAVTATNQQTTQKMYCCSPQTVSAEKPATAGVDCCASASPNQAASSSKSAKVDVESQLIFKVEGLTCPAVKGLGCGHRITPVLARLSKIEGVEKSFTNRTGTLLRISVAPSADRDKVAAAVREDLAKDNRKPVLLMGDDFKQALAKEKWGSPGELSAIEFRTLALHRVETFAQTEKLDKDTTNKLLKLAARQWDRLAQGEDCYKQPAQGEDCCKQQQQPADWLTRFNSFAAALAEPAKELLSAEQAKRLQEALSKRPGKGEFKDLPVAEQTDKMP